MDNLRICLNAAIEAMRDPRYGMVVHVDDVLNEINRVFDDHDNDRLPPIKQTPTNGMNNFFGKLKDQVADEEIMRLTKDL